jgi:hypothetical protein
VPSIRRQAASGGAFVTLSYAISRANIASKSRNAIMFGP